MYIAPGMSLLGLLDIGSFRERCFEVDPVEPGEVLALDVIDQV